MNRKGTIFLSIIIGVIIFLIGFTALNFLKDDVTTARTSLDCTNVSISDGTKLMCFGTDITMPYMILLVISIAGGFLIRAVT